MSFVLDASVALSWFFDDERNAYSEAVKDSLKRNEAWVPPLWAVEIGNGLIVAERRKRVSPQTVDRAPDIISRLPITVDKTDPSLLEMLSYARKHLITTYDALYLCLAIAKNLPVASLDGRLESACRAEGVPRFEG